MQGLFITFLWALPWVFIAVAALLAWRKKKSTMLLVQAGAAAMGFLLPMGWWVLMVVLNYLQLWNVERVLGMGIGFLEFVVLCAFAGAYCAERFLGK